MQSSRFAGFLGLGCALIQMLGGQAMASGPAYPIRPLNTGVVIAEWSSPRDFVDLNGVVYFTARAHNTGDTESATPRINVYLNWFEELKERVPTGR